MGELKVAALWGYIEDIKEVDTHIATTFNKIHIGFKLTFLFFKYSLPRFSVGLHRDYCCINTFSANTMCLLKLMKNFNKSS